MSPNIVLGNFAFALLHLNAFGRGLGGARQFPGIVRNLTPLGFQTHAFVYWLYACMWRACFYVLDGTILQVKDNSTVFFYFLAHFTVALMVFILWHTDKGRHTAHKTPTVSLIFCKIFLHLFGYCCQLCEGWRASLSHAQQYSKAQKFGLFELQSKNHNNRIRPDQTHGVIQMWTTKNGFGRKTV